MTFAALWNCLARVPDGDLKRAVHLVQEARRQRNTVFFIGNGGSAAIASHMAADFLKNGEIRAQCFNDGALTTCLSNDLGYGNVFSVPLARHAREGDLLFAISSSGQSKNILNAVMVARDVNLHIITLSGFAPTNSLRALGNVNFYVESDKYGVVEVAHHAICHAVLDQVVADGRS